MTDTIAEGGTDVRDVLVYLDRLLFSGRHWWSCPYCWRLCDVQFPWGEGPKPGDEIPCSCGETAVCVALVERR